MKHGKGLSVCGGVAIGKPFIYQPSQINETIAKTPKEEQELFEKACALAKKELQRLIKQTQEEYGYDNAAILEVQQLMLEDLDFIQGVNNQIKKGESAINAVNQTGTAMATFFEQLDDPYMKGRSVDVLDITKRLSAILSNQTPVEFPKEKFIVVAEDLAPSQTISFPRDKILGFVTQKGSASGHTAILARTLNIPALVQADISLDEWDENTLLAIDGNHNRWYSNPTKQVMDLLQEQIQKNDTLKKNLEVFRGKKTVTANGKTVSLFANIGSPLDIPAVVSGDAEGVGLMRTEFLYLGKPIPPTEEEQFEVYRTVANELREKPVILRTLDIGADKQVPFLSMNQEENPALGLRGIRMCLEHPDLFRTQLRAIYRASIYGNLHIMFPMISSLWEIKKAKKLCESVRNELAVQGYPVKPLPLGVMIETPAAALISGLLAREVDFFSVGTNDLIQYTLAVDRQNQHLSAYSNDEHPALWKLLAYVAQNANRAGIWAGVCGELAANPTAVPKLLELGYTELSMAAGKILKIRKLIFESEV